jgi:DNA (cytosine-5)-methyltransferase 1
MTRYDQNSTQPLKLGELFAGYGGLGMAVEEVFGAETAWFSEFEEAPSKILAHRWPGVPNYGDVTRIDWASVEPVDIISGGSPCQDLSLAGKRRGMTEGTRSNLWESMREGIATIRPRYVVWENVRGALSAKAISEVEHCPRCMGEVGRGGPNLRALGRVLGDLSDLGFDAEWRGVRASEVGACHQRYRVFVLAKNTDITTGSEWRQPAPGQAESGWTRPDPSGRSGTRIAADSSGQGLALGGPGGITSRQEIGATAFGDQAFTPEAAYCAGYEHGWAEALANASSSGQHGRAHLEGEGRLSGVWGKAVDHLGDGSASRPETNWGAYAPAINRWERTIGRSAPRPTEPTGRNGGERLSPRFTEWMMGLPDGWVTDPSIGISRNEQLKACGNGVVPQQAMAALRDMLAAFEANQVAA